MNQRWGPSPGACFLCLALVFVMMLVARPDTDSSHARRRADAFNRATGANITAEDARWLELRVELPPKETPDD